MPTLGTEDRLEILELYARYCHFFDAGDADRLAALFTPDGDFKVLVVGGALGRETRGTEELAANVRNGHEGPFKRRGIRHEMCNIIIEASDTGAKGTAYAMAVRVGDQQPPQIASTGRVVDEFSKGPNGWRIRSRTYIPDA